MNATQSTTRYFVGDEHDLTGLSREEVEEITLETYEEAEEAVEELMNNSYEVVAIGDLTWEAGDALRKLDPVAFRCTVSDLTVEVDLDDYPSEADVSS